MRAFIDLDYVKYAAASAGEKRTVKVIHKQSGDDWEVNNRTEWYGHHKKKAGGILSDINKSRDSPFDWEEFEYIDIQTPDKLENTLHTAKQMVEKALYQSGATDHKAFLGVGEPFRVEFSTLLKYKSNRTDMLKPLLLEDVTHYLKRKYNAEFISGIEVDDKVVIETYGKPNTFIIGVDKDYYGLDYNKFFNVNRPEEGVVNCKGVGSLWLDNKKVRGTGVAFKMFQTCSFDTTDHYRANCFSDVRWGEKAAYEALKECETYEDLFRAGYEVFKKLYPEPKVVQGWRGTDIEIDALYVMNECFNLAHMWRKEPDFVDIKGVLESFKII